MGTPKSMFYDEDEDIPMPKIEDPDEDDKDFVEAARNANNTTAEAEQFLMLSDFDRTTKLFRAALTALGNDNSGAIATLNTLLKRSEVLDKEQQEIISPMLGELKALLLSSQEELKNFNKSAQQSLEEQIKDVISKVDFSPVEEKVKAVNTQILESVNELSIKAQAIQELALKTKKLGFFASTKYLLVGLLGGAGILYGFFSYREAEIEQKLKAEFDAKIKSHEVRTSIFSQLKDDQWNASVVENAGVKNIQIVVRDTTSQANSGRGFATDSNGKKYQVSYFNIPIFK